VREPQRETIAKAIASQTYAFSFVYPEGDPHYDCGDWEDMGDIARDCYRDAADAVIAALADAGFALAPSDRGDAS